jgi:hypothetical protein
MKHFTTMDAPPQLTTESEPPCPPALAIDPTSAAMASQRPTDGADMSTTPAMPALPVIDRIDDDVRAVMDDLLGQVVHNSQSANGNLFGDALPLGDCMDLGVDDDLGIDPPAAEEATFPTEIPQRIDRFTNFDESTFDDGYDSEGGQPFMADELIVDDADAYAEEPITPAAQLPPLPLPPTQLTELIIRNSLNVSALKDELKKRGRQTGGNKSALIKRLVEAVNANVPVTENAVKRHESMNGLDVTEEWIPLTKNPIPIAEPTNEDANLRPPTERDAPVNAKYEFMERFDRLSFSGTTKNMKYIDGAKTSPCKKAIHKFTPQRMFRNEPQPRKMGGPNEKFLKRHNLDERSHPMDWFTALMPLSEGSNLEDAAKANVTGDKTTKFSVANWAKYANTKASLVHAGQPGHKFEGKYKPLTPSDITKMMGLMILDGLSPSPQLE